MPRVIVRFFATAREIARRQSMELEVDTVRELLETLSLTLGDQFKDGVMDTATGGLNRYYSCLVSGKRIDFPGGLDTVLKEGDTVAIFPIVGGGSQ
ncbi:MAG: MoaD family protein [Candidatus Thorarchaeota archaeon]